MVGVEVVVVPEVVVAERVILAPVGRGAVTAGDSKGIAFGFFAILVGKNFWGMIARVP